MGPPLRMSDRLNIKGLSVAECIQLVEEVWASIPAEQESLEITEAQKEELDRRLETHRSSQERGVTWPSAGGHVGPPLRLSDRLNIKGLSVAERIQLVEEVWASIAAEQGALGITEAQREELDRRLESHRSSQKRGATWPSAGGHVGHSFQLIRRNGVFRT